MNAAEDSLFEGRELSALAKFQTWINECNQVAKAAALGAGLPLEALAAIPSVDNNNWSAYQEIDSLLLESMSDPTRMVQIRTRSWNLRRSRIGILLELAARGISLPRVVRRRVALESDLAFFTFGDIDSFGIEEVSHSKYWGHLFRWVKWEKQPSILSFQSLKAGLGVTGSKRVKLAFEVLPEMLRFLVSIFKRLRFWRTIRAGLERNPLFRILEKDFRRAIFGLPALEVQVNSRDLRNVFSEVKPKVILVPFENQLWQRLAAFFSEGASVVGVLHSAPRKWDLRFIAIDDDLGFSPDYIVSNGQRSEDLLRAFGVIPRKILSGTALRYPGPSGSVHEMATKHVNLQKILLITGFDRNQTRALIEICQKWCKSQGFELVLRPHPATVDWMSKKFNSLSLDMGSAEEISKKYRMIISDNVSSLALELHEAGVLVVVHWPTDRLNLSPLSMHNSFQNYFSSERELGRFSAQEALSPKASILNTTNSREIWMKVIESLSNARN